MRGVTKCYRVLHRDPDYKGVQSMSSKKIFKSVGFEQEMLTRLMEDVEDKDMSLGMVVRNIVRAYYGKKPGEKNANKETADKHKPSARITGADRATSEG